MVGKRLRCAGMAVLACLAWTAPGLAATGDGFVAETGFDFGVSDDTAQVDAGIRWHLNPSSAHLWHVGARIGATSIETGPDDRVTAASVGLFTGYSHAVGRLWPTISVGVDRPFLDGDPFDLRTTVSAGGRWRLEASGSRDYALHLMGYRSSLLASGSGPDLEGYGVSVGLHQSRKSPAAYARLPHDRAWGGAGHEIAVEALAGSDDLWGGFALDAFREGGHADLGVTWQRLCVDAPGTDLTACGWSPGVRTEWHFRERVSAEGGFGGGLVPFVGIGAGWLGGNVRDFYGWEGSAAAGVRWEPRFLPFAIQISAAAKHLMGRGPVEDRTVGGLGAGIVFD
jgi:hypothetical protein